jgi:hypothetical protein
MMARARAPGRHASGRRVEPPIQPRAALGQKIQGAGGKEDRRRDTDDGDEVQQAASRITPIPIAAVTVETYQLKPAFRPNKNSTTAGRCSSCFCPS